MDAATRTLVRSRAHGRSEYCRLKEDDDVYTFHVEHIIPKKHGGDSGLENLALSCHQCNLHKGPNLAGLDPDSGQIIPLFHPRQQNWQEHFRYQGPRIEGITIIGKTTAFVLNMNDKDRVEARRIYGYGDGPLG